MTSARLVKRPPLSDLLKMEVDPGYTRDNLTLQNKPFGSTAGSSLTVASPLGQPVRAGNDTGKSIFAAAGAEGNVTGLILRSEPITALAYSGSLTFQPTLVRGPAIVNADALPILDVAGGTFTQATLITRLATLGIVVRSGPTKQTDAATDPNA